MNDTFTVMYFPFYRSVSRVDALQNIVNVPMTATIPEVQDLIQQRLLGGAVELWMPNNAIKTNKRDVLESLLKEKAWNPERFCSSLSELDSDDPLAQVLSFHPGDRATTIPRLAVEVLSAPSPVAPQVLPRASDDEEDDVVPVMRKEFISHIDDIKKAHKSPSASCQPVNYFAIQDGQAKAARRST
ncbi:hypothetical protein TRAPUB_10786, partial [Trametes pubescens]